MCHYTLDLLSGTWIWEFYYYMTYWSGGKYHNFHTDKQSFNYFQGSDFVVTLWRDLSDSTTWKVNFYNAESGLNETWNHSYTSLTWHGFQFGSETESDNEPLSGQNTWEIAESNHAQVYDSNDVVTKLTNVYHPHNFTYVASSFDESLHNFYTYITH